MNLRGRETEEERTKDGGGSSIFSNYPPDDGLLPCARGYFIRITRVSALFWGTRNPLFWRRRAAQSAAETPDREGIEGGEAGEDGQTSGSAR